MGYHQLQPRENRSSCLRDEREQRDRQCLDFYVIWGYKCYDSSSQGKKVCVKSVLDSVQGSSNSQSQISTTSEFDLKFAKELFVCMLTV